MLFVSLHCVLRGGECVTSKVNFCIITQMRRCFGFFVVVVLLFCFVFFPFFGFVLLFAFPEIVSFGVLERELSK